MVSAVAQAAALSSGAAGHLEAVLASLLVLLILLLVALLYVKCRLNVLLWYQDTHGEVEMNGGCADVCGWTGRQPWGFPALCSGGGMRRPRHPGAPARARPRRGDSVQPGRA